MWAQPQAGSGLRALKALVAVMGVLIVLGTALVVGVIVHRLYAESIAPSTAPMAPLPGRAVITLPQGSRIVGIAAAGGLLAVAVSGQDGDAVWLVDPRSGAHSIAVTTPK